MESLVITTFSFLLIANLFVLGTTSLPNNNNTDLVQCLISQLRSSSLQYDQLIYTPKNPQYSTILQSTQQNLRPGLTTKYQPLIILTPNDESEIQAAVYCSKKHDVQIKVRSGGHDYEGLSYVSEVPNFMVVDMRNLRKVSVNTTDSTLWVGAGATLGELYYHIAEKSNTLAFPAGVCPTVGLGGHLSGGGYSMISRKYGLSVDHIIDAKVIGVDGRVLDRRLMGEDHFWAIRGGGATSFGIILAFKLQLVPVPEIVTVFNVTKTTDQNATNLVHKWQYICDKIDERISIRLFISSRRSSEDGKQKVHVSFTSMFLGRANEFLMIMNDVFPELGLVENDFIEMSWIESVVFFAELHNEPVEILLRRRNQNLYFKSRSDYVTRPIPVSGIEGMWSFQNEEDERVGEIQISPYGGKISTFSESESPFPHRAGNIYIIHISAEWHSKEHDVVQRHVNWSRRLYEYLTPFVSNSPRTAYFNYRDLDIGISKDNEGKMLTSYEQASIWGFKYFKNNFNRLVRIKTKVDPDNFFRNEQSIPPLPSLASRANRLNNGENIMSH